MSATIFRSLDEARGRLGPCALAIGNFDGVHLGHQALLKVTIRLAEEHHLHPAVLTFHPHPAAIVAPERCPELISTLDQPQASRTSSSCRSQLRFRASRPANSSLKFWSAPWR